MFFENIKNIKKEKKIDKQEEKIEKEIELQEKFLREIVAFAKKVARDKEKVFKDIQGLIKVLSVVFLMYSSKLEATPLKDNKVSPDSIKNVFSVENVFKENTSDLKKRLDTLLETEKEIKDTSFFYEIVYERKDEKEFTDKKIKGNLPKKGDVLENVLVSTKTNVISKSTELKDKNKLENEKLTSFSLVFSKEKEGYFEPTNKILHFTKEGATKEEALIHSLEELSKRVSVEVFSMEVIQEKNEKYSENGFWGDISKFAEIINTKSVVGFNKITILDIREKVKEGKVFYEVEIEGVVGVHK